MSSIQENIARKEQELAMLQTMRRNTTQLLTTLREFSQDFEGLNDNVSVSAEVMGRWKAVANVTAIIANDRAEGREVRLVSVDNDIAQTN